MTRKSARKPAPLPQPPWHNKEPPNPALLTDLASSLISAVIAMRSM
jgi:hypothetical protein